MVVRPQETANDGEIVVALVGEEATVKRFFQEADHVRLQPENDAMEPIRSRDVRVLGQGRRPDEEHLVRCARDVAPTLLRHERWRPALFDGLGGEPTLDQLITGVWEGLAAHAAVRCPVCEGEMRPEYGRARRCRIGRSLRASAARRSR